MGCAISKLFFPPVPNIIHISGPWLRSMYNICIFYIRTCLPYQNKWHNFPLTQRQIYPQTKMAFCFQNCSSVWENLLKFEAEGQKFAKILRSIYSNSERSDQFLKQNVFLTWSLMFLRSNRLEQLKFKLKKIIGI